MQGIESPASLDGKGQVTDILMDDVRWKRIEELIPMLIAAEKKKIAVRFLGEYRNSL